MNREGGRDQKFDAPKRGAILDLSQYLDKAVRVKFIGGREVIGTLNGFDQLMNLVLSDVHETLRGMLLRII